MIRQRIRVRFAKRGDLRFIGHRDFMECFFRLLRRAYIKPSMSEGFHPKPRVSFPAALPLGVVGEDEILEMEMGEQTDAEILCGRLQKATIPGVEFLAVELLPTVRTKARVKFFEYVFAVPADRRENLNRRAAWVEKRDTLPVQRVGREEKTVDVKHSLISLGLEEDGVLRFRLRADIPDSCGPRDVLAVLEIADVESLGSVIVRSRVILEPEAESVS